jgi:hypothetical protein
MSHCNYNLYTRGRGDFGSSPQSDGPRSNWTYSLAFTQTMSSSNMAIFEEGAVLLSRWTGAILIRVKIG